MTKAARPVSQLHLDAAHGGTMGRTWAFHLPEALPPAFDEICTPHSCQPSPATESPGSSSHP
jgi:hypothetical protein